MVARECYSELLKAIFRSNTLVTQMAIIKWPR